MNKPAANDGMSKKQKTTAAAAASFMSVVLVLLHIPFAPIRFLLNRIPGSGFRFAAKLSVCAIMTLGLFYLWAKPLYKHGYRALNDKATYIRYDDEGDAGPWSATLALYTIAGGISLAAVSWLLVASGRNSIQSSVISKNRALFLMENGYLPETYYGGSQTIAVGQQALRNSDEGKKIGIEAIDGHYRKYLDDGFLNGTSGLPIIGVLVIGQLMPLAWGGSANPLWTDYVGLGLIHFIEGIIYTVFSARVDLGELNIIATLPVLALVYTLPITWAYNFLGVGAKNILTVNEISESAPSGTK